MKKIIVLTIVLAFSQSVFAADKSDTQTQITIQQVQDGKVDKAWSGRATMGQNFQVNQTAIIKYHAKCKVTDPHTMIPPGEVTTGLNAIVRPLQRLDQGYLVHIAFQYTELVQMRIEKVRDCDIELPISNTLGLPSQTLLLAPGEKHTISYRKQDGEQIEFKFSID